MKRLYKNKKEKKIFGVCAGLAEYFDCDPIIVRLIFLGLLICGSFGFWIYIIAALIMPDKEIII